jgi:glyoxylase-like metal-dependent hydrolase (beta-lactamase superfamily II)
MRRSLLREGSTPWADFLSDRSLELDTAALLPFGTWITPSYSPIRYRAPYYLLRLNNEQEPSIWPGELVEGQWLLPEHALEKHDAGELCITYPVLETLRIMVEYGDKLESAAQILNDESFGPYQQPGGEMLAGVHMLPVKTFTLPPATHTNCYVLGRKDLIVVDPATPIEEEQRRLIDYIENLVREGGELKEIWLTHHHKDHIGAVEAVREHFRVPVAAHPETAKALEGKIPIDRMIPNGEVTTLDCTPSPAAKWVALHTPGHARGHLCFYEQNHHSVITGDNVLGLGTVLIAPPEGNMRQYLASLEQLLKLELGIMLPAHGPTVANTRDRIEFYIEHRMARESSIVDALENTSLTPAEIVPRVYTDAPPYVYPLAEMNVQAHLEKLEEEKRVSHENGRFQLVR